MDEPGKSPIPQPLARPLLRDWFWRPWYSKLWIAIIFLVLLLGYLLPRDILRSHEGVATLSMALVLNPYLFIGGLGFGYFRAAWKYRFGLMMPVEEDDWEWQRRSQLSDPSDPANPMWYWYRHRRDRI
jgi:hypothetical protein